jgi:hypothetical protein
MPQVSTELNSQYWEPVAIGPSAQCDISSSSQLGTLPGTLPATTGTFTSNLVQCDGFLKIAAGVLSTQAGTIQIQRYVDKAGLIPQGAAISTTLVAATPNVVNANDGLPFQSFTIKVTNTGGSVATISNFVLLLNA